jgi:hypothetical protein
VVDIRISGIPPDTYNIFFFFTGGGEESYNPNKDIENIIIVNNIPYELPYTGETTPESFNQAEPNYIYEQYSSYATSTALFTGLTDTLKPLTALIGGNLTFFSSQFNQADAKDTGEKAGNAVLLVRSYANNMNSFFSDLPVSEILFLYLMALVGVVVFRLVRLLLKLIPFT